MLEKSLWPHMHDNAFHASCDSRPINALTGLPFDKSKVSDNCFKSSSVESLGNEFCANDPILGKGGAVVDSNFCRFLLGDISPADNDLEFYGNEHEDKESSILLDYGWSDIGNFEDIDRMFRNCDSTFGEENICTMAANELSWFPASSHEIDGSDDALKPGVRSSCSESSALKSKSKHCEAAMKSMPGSDPPLISSFDRKSSSYTCKTGSWTSDADEPPHLGHCHYTDWLNADAENEGESASVKLVDEGTCPDEVKLPPLEQLNNAVERSSDPLSKPSTFPEQKAGKLHQWQQVRAASTIENQQEHCMCQTAFGDPVPVQKKLHQIQHEVGDDSEVKELGMELPAVEINSSIGQESSCMSFVLLDELSLEAISFCQLQDDMEQLDIRTKLCIRDSLYRLSRSAEQRRNLGSTNGSSKDSRGGSGAPSAEESNMCVGSMDVETDTNPIDRAVVHLLFYRPFEPSKRSSNGSLSLESIS
ncbi:protein LNK1-like isoform X3 [Magnolia sinica]|nr:protein LNK1-like isoform X2 [Magnolia sinica]XP_058096785.1 protein LNK1-like isoform X3 [Magnolia sinica]